MTTATQNKSVLITGNTYPVKDQLRAMGGLWNPEAKGWMVPADRADEARRLVGGGSPAAGANRSTYRPSKCQVCGVHASGLRAPYERIGRDGVCSGCRSDRRQGFDAD